jgi:hypothetical protein
MGSRALSSITDRRHSERGQILVLFAGGLVLMLALAALVFDVGQNLLDRRTEQNASDAAALAGARYIPAANFSGSCPAGSSGNQAVDAACRVARDNGFVNGGNTSVIVKYPPGPEAIGPHLQSFSNDPKAIEVRINNTRSSIFSGVLGATTQHTGAISVAQNAPGGYALPFSLLALDPTSCSKNAITGGGVVTVSGAIHIDSSCTAANGGALLLNGGGTLTAPSCDVVGQIKNQSGPSSNNCAQSPTGIQVSGDPVAALPPPAVPALAPAIQLVSGTGTSPNGCPGSATPQTGPAPVTCTFGGQSKDSVWRLFPGYYPGGLAFNNNSTYYLEPGIYYIGGGGLSVSLGAGGQVLTVAAGGTTFGGGILVYNTEDATYHSQCAGIGSFPAGVAASAACYGQLKFDGSSTVVKLKPIQAGPYKNMLIFVDRNLSNATASPSNSAADIIMNGSSSNLSLSGTIYAPKAIVQINGNGATTISTQIIAYDVQISGSGGTLAITYNSDQLFHLSGSGLVCC